MQTFEAAYGRWKTEAERNGHKTKLVLSLGHFKGLSAAFSNAHGRAVLDLADGSLSVEVSGLSERENFDIWLVHNRPGPGRSVKPEPGDRMIRAGQLVRDGDKSRLQTALDRDSLIGFKLDLMVVTANGRNPMDSGLLFAAPNVFQKLYYSEPSTANLISTKLSDPGDRNNTASGLLLAPFRSLIPTLAYADKSHRRHFADLIARGEELFFEETFRGNGRTCGTCHPAENNFTIDPQFIATLPKRDPLFVAEFNNHLNSDKNGGRHFEIPHLMRQFGLILENVDGFDDLKNKFVMRGTPHTLAQALSIDPAPANPFIPGSTTPFDGTSGANRTGWGGDGSPNGTLRGFAIGAVKQHFTRTLNRIPGVDFRLPSDAELDAIEAFMLSLGRQSELNVIALQPKLKDADVRAGLAVFNDPNQGKCSFCHSNAGANQGIFPPIGIGNANFNTGIEAALANQGLHGPLRPIDGGNGTVGTLADGFGNGTFNTPPLVEAADKRAFFHNNLCNTIECAVGFYTTSAFDTSPAGILTGGINLGQFEVFGVAAFLRVINALENIRSAIEKLENAQALSDSHAHRPLQLHKLLRLVIVDIDDGYRVLNEGRDPQFKQLGLHPEARTLLEYAKDNCEMVQSSRSKKERNYRIAEALNALAVAKMEIVNP